jgi:release factor glutamine methyltransferase
MNYNFSDVYRIFKEHGVKDLLSETLKFFDIIHSEKPVKSDISPLGESGIDLRSIAAKRRDQVPLEYIMGMAPFMGMSFACTPDTLIPRGETRLLVQTALKLIRSMQEGGGGELTVVDIGTGCGNIAVTLALRSQDMSIIATDISPAAVEVARHNVDAYGLEDRVSLCCGDLFDPLRSREMEGRIDVIVCNPPYIPTTSLGKLSAEITDHEPHVALDAGPYGINVFRKLIGGSLDFLKTGGALVFEIGEGQEKLVGRLFEKNGGYESIRYHVYGAVIRVISAVKAAV